MPLLNTGSAPNDGTGDTLRVAGQKINRLPNPDSGLNAGSGDYVGTTEAKITAMIADGMGTGRAWGWIPNSMLPYDESLVTFNSAFQLVPEGDTYRKGIYNARAYGGSVTAWHAIAKCAQMLPSTGGTIDCTGFTGNQTAGFDLMANVTGEKPMKFVFGPSTWTCSHGDFQGICTFYGSNIEWNMNGTTFILSSGETQAGMFVGDVTGQFGGTGACAVTNGSNQVVIQNLSRGVVPKIGKTIAIFGHLPSHGMRDNTTLNGAIDNVTTTIVLTSTTGQIATNGYIRIDNEIISYTSFSGNSLVGAVRGALGTTTASHSNGAAVDRVVYDNYRIDGVTGTGPWTVTLGETVTNAPNMTATSAQIGPYDLRFTGNGTLDGGDPLAGTLNAVNVTPNASAIQIWWAGRVIVENGITIRNFEHSGVNLYQCRDCVIDGKYENIGTQSAQIGFSILFFWGSKYCTALGDHTNVNMGPACDDRTTQATYYDNGIVGCVLKPRTVRNVWRGGFLSGARNCYASFPVIDTWNYNSSGGAAFGMEQNQWVTMPVLPQNNYVELGWVSPTGNAVYFSGVSGCFVRSSTPGVQTNSTNGVNYMEYVDSAGALHFGPGGGTDWTVSGEVHIDKTRSAATATQEETLLATGTWTVADSGLFKVAVEGVAVAAHTAGTMSCPVVGAYMYGRSSGNGGTSNLVIGLKAGGQALTGSTIVDFRSISAETPNNSGTITTATGVFVESINTASTNYAIFTNLGKVRFGDNLWLGGGSDHQNVGIGIDPAGALHVQLYLNGTVTTSLSNTSYNLVADGVHPSTSTSEVAALYGRVRTSAVSYTLTAAKGLLVKDAIKGGGSTITSQYGIYVDAQTQGGSNYAFWSNGSSDRVRIGAEVNIAGDVGGIASTNTLTGTSDLTANSTGVGTILFKGATSRNSAGFIKFYIGTTAHYVPVFTAITG